MLVSIITPSYNSESFIEACINSVIAQSYTNWELIIVDDCSIDNTKEIIEKLSLSEKRIKPVFLEKNVGPANARNIALELARGRFIAFLDSDDLWLPLKIQKQIEFMCTNNIAFCFSEYEVISEDGETLINTIKVPQKINYNQYLSNTIIGCLTVMIDKEKTKSFRMQDIRSSHDMVLWLELMKRGFDAYGMQQCLAQYRLVSTSNTAKKKKAVIDVWRVYRDIENLNIFFSIYCFIGYVFNAIRKRL